jgi:hypothetical protein
MTQTVVITAAGQLPISDTETAVTVHATGGGPAESLPILSYDDHRLSYGAGRQDRSQH